LTARNRPAGYTIVLNNGTAAPQLEMKAARFPMPKAA